MYEKSWLIIWRFDYWKTNFYGARKELRRDQIPSCIIVREKVRNIVLLAGVSVYEVGAIGRTLKKLAVTITVCVSAKIAMEASIENIMSVCLRAKFWCRCFLVKKVPSPIRVWWLSVIRMNSIYYWLKSHERCGHLFKQNRGLMKVSLSQLSRYGSFDDLWVQWFQFSDHS